MPPSAPLSQFDFVAQRQVMVDRQVRTFDVTDQRVLTRMLETPREIFLPAALAPFAYSDKPLEIGQRADPSRRLLPPMILARMMQAAKIVPQDRFLEIGSGGGYGAAIVAGLAASALAIDSDEDATRRAQAAFESLGLRNATAKTGALETAGGMAGPFDVIIINGGVETIPDSLLAVLAEGGRLLAIYREANDPTGYAAQAVMWERCGADVGRRRLFTASMPILNGFTRKKEFVF